MLIYVYIYMYIYIYVHIYMYTFQQHAKTDECKYSIEFEYMKYVRALADDTPYPFENEVFKSQCPTASNKYRPMVR
jgi:hypothetical protein